jgi:protein-S-isoprenylcysteine O-methyltransferase Ste14
MSSMTHTLASISGYALMVVSIVILLMERSLLGESPVPIGIQVVAVVLMVWARLTFGRRSFHIAANPTEGGMVTSGPYRYIRHPIYASVLYFTWAGVLSHFTAVNLILGICAVAGVFMRITAEEKLLVGRYPEYGEYAGRTKRLVPFLV